MLDSFLPGKSTNLSSFSTFSHFHFEWEEQSGLVKNRSDHINHLDVQGENHLSGGRTCTSQSRVSDPGAPAATPPEGTGHQGLPDREAPGCDPLPQKPRPPSDPPLPPQLPPLQRHQPGPLPQGGCGGSSPPQSKGRGLCRTPLGQPPEAIQAVERFLCEGRPQKLAVGQKHFSKSVTKIRYVKWMIHFYCLTKTDNLMRCL